MPELNSIYQRLLDYYGPRNWWPADSPFEMAVGAILTQNTNWRNVERAIANLRAADMLTPTAVDRIPLSELESLIRPSGFFRQKAERLKLLSNHLCNSYQGSLEQMLKQDLDPLRKELLALKGIGPETADSILLYAGAHPSFVVDAYTRRIFGRLGVLSGNEKYAEIRALFMRELPHDSQIYNEYHALIVVHAKDHCRTKPLCASCPLAGHCPYPSRSK